VTAAQDKNQLGLTDTAREEADYVVEHGGFDERQDVYRLAVAIALVKQLEPAPEDAGGRTTYINVGSLDPEGLIRTAIAHSREEAGERPYAFAERLAEAGIVDLHRHLHGGRSLGEYFAALVEENGEGTP
jgi:hypothetical protein